MAAFRESSVTPEWHARFNRAVAGTNQTSDIGRAHPTPRLVAQILQIRLEPPLEIPMPIFFHRQPPSKLAPYESRISRIGNPKKSPFCQSSASMRPMMAKAAELGVPLFIQPTAQAA
jgi:hypothetical protein